MAPLCFTSLFLLMIAGSTITAAEEFKVGGDERWRQPAADEVDMYKKWSEALRFHVQDSLRFVYKNDSVMVVEKLGYYHCNTSKAGAVVFKDGNTVVNLERPGPAYFASGDPDHCKSGQRLLVEVIKLRSADAPSPSAAATAGGKPSSLHLLFFFLLLVASSSLHV